MITSCEAASAISLPRPRRVGRSGVSRRQPRDSPAILCPARGDGPSCDRPCGRRSGRRPRGGRGTAGPVPRSATAPVVVQPGYRLDARCPRWSKLLLERWSVPTGTDAGKLLPIPAQRLAPGSAPGRRAVRVRRCCESPCGEEASAGGAPERARDILRPEALGRMSVRSRQGGPHGFPPSALPEKTGSWESIRGVEGFVDVPDVAVCAPRAEDPGTQSVHRVRERDVPVEAHRDGRTAPVDPEADPFRWACPASSWGRRVR